MFEETEQKLPATLSVLSKYIAKTVWILFVIGQGKWTYRSTRFRPRQRNVCNKKCLRLRAENYTQIMQQKANKAGDIEINVIQ